MYWYFVSQNVKNNTNLLSNRVQATAPPPCKVPAGERHQRDKFFQHRMDGDASLLLNKRLVINVIDGRIVVGDFICMDKQGNIILYNAVERLEQDGQPEEKDLGQILVPHAQQRRVQVEVCSRDEESIRRLLA